MSAQQINRLSGRVVLVLSLIALLTVLFGYTIPRGTAETDEGTGAHIFQLSIAALLPTILVFLMSADWKQPRQSARPLLLGTTALILAFAALYCLEHYWHQPQ
jgi:hypothetical protein